MSAAGAAVLVNCGEAHLDGAIAALEAIIFPPKLQPRGVQHDAHAADDQMGDRNQEARDTRSSCSSMISTACVVLLIISLITAVIALIVSVSIE